MMSEFVITVVSHNTIAAQEIVQLLAPIGACIAQKPLQHHLPACDFVLRLNTPATQLAAAQAVRSILGSLPLDYAVQPHPKPAKHLFIADMDSTMISIECIDELAGVAGIKPHVAEITERAMAGELDFEGALIARVALLKHLPLSAVDEVFETVLQYNPGSEALIAALNAAGIHTLLVSGGFTLFTKRVATYLGFLGNRANVLNHNGETLTGTVGTPILGKEAKLQALNETCTQLGCTAQNAIAIGDGANDGLMVQAAGLGIAYHAKPVLKDMATASIDHTDLTTVLAFIS